MAPDSNTAIGLPPPFWAFAWAGGQVLARYLLDNPALVQGKRALDFAAGSGLVAIAAAKAGAAEVQASDVDAFAVAARAGAENELGLGAALGRHIEQLHCPHAKCSLVLAAYRAGIPCTIHVALGTDIVHMHPHVCGAALGTASLIDFRRLCSVVATAAHGVWMNLGSAVVMPEVFVKAVAVARNFGHDLDGLVTVNLDKQAQYRSRVNVLERPSAEGIELIDRDITDSEQANQTFIDCVFHRPPCLPIGLAQPTGP